MDGSASKPCSTTRGIGLVKAAVNLYRNRNIADVNSPSLKKNFSTGYEDKVVASQIQRFVTQKLPSIQSAVWWTSSVEKVIMLYFLWMTTRLMATPPRSPPHSDNPLEVTSRRTRQSTRLRSLTTRSLDNP
ncbi:uncharacterized protein [Glycine max]|uniref:uncharacterized protein isoform X4 n=1 Tax=Glycine max TaxID=3847 RepID=UPI000719296D|nr:uncharacterized protein LOC100783453 isoform X4 [Glycine max]|eukprot:XP_014625800.1 uncharacterized protein LOC100783453 isoform X4 [Glycine max]